MQVFDLNKHDCRLAATCCIALFLGCGNDTATTSVSATAAEGTSSAGFGSTTDGMVTTAAESTLDPPSDTSLDPTTEGSTSGMEPATCDKPKPPGPLPHYPVEIEFPEFLDAKKQFFLLHDAAAFESFFGFAAPPGMDYPNSSSILFSLGLRPIPGHRVEVDRVEWVDGCTVKVDWRARAPGPNCETFAWARPTAALVRIPVVLPADTQIQLGDGEVVDVDCAIEGGEGSCDAENLCAPGLLCGGVTNDGKGSCRPLEHWGLFATGPLDLGLPDGGQIIDSIMASGLTSVDIDVIVRVELNHPDPSQLQIWLSNPYGTENMVWDQEPGPLAYPWIEFDGSWAIHRAVPFSQDENVNGPWTLRVADVGGDGQGGAVVAWSVEVMSRWD